MKTRPMCAALLAAALLTGLGAIDLTPGLSLASKAQAQDSVQRVNDAFAAVQANRRSDLELLPLLAKLEKPPAAVNTRDKAALLPANSPDFAAAAAWAQAEPQKAVLAALQKVTQETDWKKSWAFGQPYGAEHVSPDIIRTGMYTELGDPPMLGAARHQYMPAMDIMASLANVEATRLAADGKPAEAVTVLINLAYFGRQMFDRQFFVEAAWGLDQISHSMERIRDVAYTDLRGAKKYDTNAIADQIKRLVEADQGYMNLDRTRFPTGNRAAAEQLVARLYEGDKINEPVFAATMARMGSSEHPLRLFSVAAQYQAAAKGQEGGYVAADKVKGVYSDFDRRWKLPYHDPARSLVSEYTKLSRGKLAVLEATTQNFNDLIEQRMQARVELAGTRMALALAGFTHTNGNVPATISAVRPRWMAQIEDDLYDRPVRQGRTSGPLQYFVPMPKPSNPREVAKPHEMQVYTENAEANFKVSFQDDVFILYSVGTDYGNNGAKRIQNTTKVVQGADYLFWPPVMSLYRQHLIDRGDIKVTE
jgi:hypothetical protein